MKAILEFNLDDPDQRQEHLRCVKSLDMAVALFEISYNFTRKFEDDDNYDKICEEMSKILYDINMDELIR